MKIFRFPNCDMVMRFYWGSAIGHTYAHMQSSRDGHEGGISSGSQDPICAVSDDTLEDEREIIVDHPDLEFTLESNDDDDWDGADDVIDDRDDSYYALHAADELFAPMCDA
jgi:hypothetical protein